MADSHGFTHLGNTDAAPNGSKRLTECHIWTARASCVRINAVTCPACLEIIARCDRELATMAAGFGMRLENGLLVNDDEASL